VSLRAGRLSRRLRRGAELAAAAMFAAMFGAFVVQVVTRYVLQSPAGWTLEFATLAYVWVVFFAAAFLLQDREHIAFDMLYQAAGPGKRRVLAIAQSLILLVTFLIALPGTFDYVTFMSRERTWILQIPFSLAFSCFVLFMAMVILRSGLRIWRLLGRDWPDELG
jgi:TRAP-type C4-dicarboxylate transport system permease small subunit